MCGIFGIVGKRSAGIGDALARGTRALIHRGPDDEGMEVLPLAGDDSLCLALGSRRLAIQDLSPAGHQPMLDPVTGNWLIFNGEIYNFLELRAELQACGHVFHSHSDTEVLLQAYAQWGSACVDRLRGMFAFAIWDASQQKLLLARDPLGVKPLYYYSKGPFVFASELRALLKSGLVPKTYNPTGLSSFLWMGAVQDPLTAVEDVWSLPAGHFIEWQNGALRTHCYWSMAEVASRPPLANSVEGAVEGLRPILLDAVRLRLVSDVPIGTFLSGGIDSSAIVSLVKEIRQPPLDTFSVVFGGDDFCEATHSSLISKIFGTHHHQISIPETVVLDRIGAALDAIDQPTLDGVNTFMISRAVRDAGITVALSGVGSDEIFGGYSATFGRVPKLLALRGLVARGQPLWKIIERVSGSHANALEKLSAIGTLHPYLVVRALFLPDAADRLFHLNGQHKGWQGEGEFGTLLGSIGKLDPINQISVLEGSVYLGNMLLRDTDAMSMAASLEVRGPFLDRKLWEYLLPLRGRLKLDSRLPKHLLLKSLKMPLPERIYARKKMGFTLPFEQWLRGPLKPMLEQELGRNAVPMQPLEPWATAQIWESFLRGRTSWSRPWALFVLRHWIRRHLS